MMTGGNPLVWKPELGTRIAIIPRDRTAPDAVGPPRRVLGLALRQRVRGRRTDPPRLPVQQRPGDDAGSRRPSPDVTYGFTRATLDPAAGTADLQHLDAIGTEFPRIDDRLTGLVHRYLTVAGRSGSAALKMGEHDVLHRYDMTAGTSTHYDAGAAIGEVTFAPRTGSTHELDGYYLAFGTGLDDGSSSLYIWDAAEFPAPPVATRAHPPACPQRAPRQLVRRRRFFGVSLPLICNGGCAPQTPSPGCAGCRELALARPARRSAPERERGPSETRRHTILYRSGMEWPEGFMWGTGASSTQCEGAAPASDWWAWERDGHAPPSGDGNGFGSRYAEDFGCSPGSG